MTSIRRREYAKLSVGLAALLLGLMAVYGLEQAWPTVGWWVFVVLTLSLGMGHGALDAVLLLAQFVPKSKALRISAGYFLLVLLTGWLLSWSLGWALLALIAMSLWHFGELQSDPVSRIAVGGASVMAPMFVANNQLAALIEPVLQGDHFAAWLVWYWLAISWCVLVVAWLAFWLFHWAGQQQASSRLHVNWRHPQMRALLEIVCVMGLYAIFSPLLAFALYFGLYHCTVHIARVKRAVINHYGLSKRQLAWAWFSSMLLTGLLMAALWKWLPSTGQSANLLDAQILHWLIVALGAVTVPHLLLVSYSRRWLQQPALM